jgi:hypothetical protein
VSADLQHAFHRLGLKAEELASRVDLEPQCWGEYRDTVRVLADVVLALATLRAQIPRPSQRPAEPDA